MQVEYFFHEDTTNVLNPCDRTLKKGSQPTIFSLDVLCVSLLYCPHLAEQGCGMKLTWMSTETVNR